MEITDKSKNETTNQAMQYYALLANESELLFAFFMWFRENGEKYMNESIEKMIQTYLKSKL